MGTTSTPSRAARAGRAVRSASESDAEAPECLGQAQRGAVGAVGGGPDVEPLHRVVGEVDVDRRQLGGFPAVEPAPRGGHEEVEQVILAARRCEPA